jgi:hypothetical protein
LRGFEPCQHLPPNDTSGYTDDAILRHGVLDAACHFVGKPYGAAVLTRKVREVLDLATSP